MKKPIKRTLIFRECPKCKNGAFVRKDGIGKFCRACRAKFNSENKIGIYKEISGKKFGKLKAICVHKKSGKYYWECLCDCGNMTLIYGGRLRNGLTRSCGCITATRNGQSTTKIHSRWRAMISRCYDTKNINYKNYGGRGIIVCDSWKNSPENFIKDMGEIPTGMTLDRIDSNGNYEPKNCRWISPKEQCNNKRNNYMITAFGKTQTLTQWSDEVGLSWSLIRQRLERGHWSSEKALTKIPKKKK